MERPDLPAPEGRVAARSAAVRRAARSIVRGGVVAYPTEAVYGLGCDPGNERALRRLLALKRRSWTKGVILIASDPAQLEPYLTPIHGTLRRRLDATWPGPVTWLLPARAGVSRLLRGSHPCIAVRVTAHPLAAALCRQVGGAVVSTSANCSGCEPCRDHRCVLRSLGRRLDAVLRGGVGDEARPTRIIDGISGKVVRS